jgi:transcriptional regulator with XRE-family HTH domain
MDEPKHPIAETLMQLIRELRLKGGLSLETAADQAGIHRTYLGLLERGERQPTLSVAIQIARSLNFELSSLLLKAELIDAGKLKRVDAFAETLARKEKPECIRNVSALEEWTGLSSAMLLQSIQTCYSMLDTIDAELVASGVAPIGRLVELANLSSMVGNMVAGAIAESSDGLYCRNKPHHYPDLLPQKELGRNLELKMALETNRPKGHLPKPGDYLTFRYVLGDRNGNYTRGKESRGDTVWIWEAKVGRVREQDFDISNTEGDSGKTAVVKTAVFNKMPLVYFDPVYCPFASRRNPYPGFN